MSTRIKNAEERYWDAQNDARTLAEAMNIRKDSSRMKEAVQAADRMAREKRKEANSMSSVARRKPFGSNGNDKKPIQKKKSTNNVYKGKTVRYSGFNVFQKI